MVLLECLEQPDNLFNHHHSYVVHIIRYMDVAVEEIGGKVGIG